MHAAGGTNESSSVEEPSETSPSHCVHPPHDDLLSPSIQRASDDLLPAFELKFLVSTAIALEIEAWGAKTMQRDRFADPQLDGAYQTTTLYLDTPAYEVYHRAQGHRRSKLRLRRYGQESRVYLERKTRRGDRVRKRRSDVQLGELPLLLQNVHQPQPDAWFCAYLHSGGFRPACRMTYDRTAFVQPSEDGPLRLTLDRRIRGIPAEDWDLTPLDDGHGILPDHVVCEFKFRAALPNIFKEMIRELCLETGSVSKYRRMMVAAGIVGGEDSAHV